MVHTMKNFRGFLKDLLWQATFLIGMATGCAMTVLGLMVRIRNAVPRDGFGTWFGLPYLTSAGLQVSFIGWALVLLGMFWIGALVALVVKNRWGDWSVPCASVISLAFFPGGTLAGVLAILVLIPMLLRRMGWLTAKNPEGA
jgi:hypothetical protein